MVEIRVVLPDELYEPLVKSCRDVGATVEECAGKLLEYLLTGRICPICVALVLATSEDKLRKAICHSDQ